MAKLTMPEDVTLRYEFWRGFGKVELLRTTVVTAVITGVCGLVCLLCRSQDTPVICVIAALLAAFSCVGVFSKLEGGLSVYDFMQLRKRARAEQQSFPYRYRREEVIEFAGTEEDER